MKPHKLLRLLIVFLSISIWGNLSAAALELADLDNPKVTEAFVDGLVIPLMAIHNSPSGTVAIIKNGKLIFSKGYGHQNIEKQIPVDPDSTLFRAGSVSKLFTWVAVMQMVEQGKLDLDTDVNHYLKRFKIKDTFPGQPITMRHIMTHTAGFEDGAMGYLILEDQALTTPLAEAMERFQPERVNPPGAQTAYSNYATSVAGLIVANISGQEFTAYIKEHILDVLGMEKASFVEPLPDHLNENMAVTYAYGGGIYIEKPFELSTGFSPAGALSVTSVDMVKFAQAILNGGEYEGGRILKAETVKQMLTRNFSHDDRLMGMALGFFETERNGFRFVGHGGDTIFFHSELVIDQENDMAFFVSFGGQGGAVARDAFREVFYEAFASTEKVVVTAPSDFAERAGEYAGNYLFWRANYSTIEKLSLLTSGTEVVVSADNSLMIMGVKFVETEKNLFQKVGGSLKIAFQENAKGEITGFVMDGAPSMSLYKGPFYYSSSFNFLGLALAGLIFSSVILRGLYQRPSYKALGAADKKAARASLITAGLGLFTVLFCSIVLSLVFDQLVYVVPTIFKIALAFPILATAASFYHLYNTVIVWRDGLCSGIWARIRYSFVTLAALFMCWFYYFWNILGWDYLA